MPVGENFVDGNTEMEEWSLPKELFQWGKIEASIDKDFSWTMRHPICPSY